MFSILDGFSSCQDNCDRAKSLNMDCLSLSDHGTIAGHISHFNACKKVGIKPIFSIELYCCHQDATIKNASNRSNQHAIVVAKNKQGWNEMFQLVSQTNDKNYFYYKPRIHIFDTEHVGLEHFLKNGNLILINGHQGTALSSNLFCDIMSANEDTIKKLKAAYSQTGKKTTDDYRSFLKPNWLESTCELARNLERIAGKGNFFIELQNELNVNDRLALHVHPLIVDCLREVSARTGIPAIASSDPHYARKEQAPDQRIMVSCNMKETEESVQRKLDSNDEMDLMVFFGSDEFYIHSYEEMAQKFTKEELELTNKIADSIEEFSIDTKPYIPNFELPNFSRDKEYLQNISKEHDKFLMHLCIEGAKKIKPWESLYSKQKGLTKNSYWDRIKIETKTIFEAGLSEYFLVVWDYCMAADHRPKDHSFDWVKNLQNGGEIDPVIRGPGRGSAAGCLISYLMFITSVDPLQYDLLFGRFYNAGRNTKDHVEFPDIDCDMSVVGRDWVIEYIKHKYGHDKVAGVLTLQRMQGKAAFKDVCRVKGLKGGFELTNEMCNYIPSEAEIADEIQDYKKATGEDYGILKWCLHNSEKIQEFYKDKDIKEAYDQAIRCEGVKKAQGRHPSALVITPIETSKCFPMVLDTKSENKEKIIGFDMNDMAKLGGIKMDLLGIAILDKMKLAEDMINEPINNA